MERRIIARSPSHNFCDLLMFVLWQMTTIIVAKTLFDHTEGHIEVFLYLIFSDSFMYLVLFKSSCGIFRYMSSSLRQDIISAHLLFALFVPFNSFFFFECRCLVKVESHGFYCSFSLLVSHTTSRSAS